MEDNFTTDTVWYFKEPQKNDSFIWFDPNDWKFNAFSVIEDG